MNNLFKKLSILSLSCLFFSTSASALDIFKADQYYKEKNYPLAKEEYLKATKVGNPYAAYQLATIYYKGLDGKKDIFRVHEQELNTNVTIASTDNALAAGPLSIASSTTLTVSGNLTIV